jgi:hypothetical protein
MCVPDEAVDVGTRDVLSIEEEKSRTLEIRSFISAKRVHDLNSLRVLAEE